MKGNRFSGILGIMAVALGVYWGSYFAVVRVMLVGWADGPILAPSYARLPAPLNSAARLAFAPAHHLDRRLLRPRKWDGSTPLTPGSFEYYP